MTLIGEGRGSRGLQLPAIAAVEHEYDARVYTQLLGQRFELCTVDHETHGRSVWVVGFRREVNRLRCRLPRLRRSVRYETIVLIGPQ